MSHAAMIEYRLDDLGCEELPRSRISGKGKVVRPLEQTPFANGSFRETSLVRPGTNGSWTWGRKQATNQISHPNNRLNHNRKALF